MRRIILLTIYLFCLSHLSAKTITDMAGRSVNIPDKIERILPYDAKSSILLFPVAYEKMVAKAFLPGSKKNQYISDKYNLMPEVDIKNIELVLASNPQIIIAGAYISSANLERFEKLEKRTHIPVVIIDLSINKIDLTYEFIATLLDQNEQSFRCAEFVKSVYRQTEKLLAQHPVKDISVYYSIGGSGLMTDPAGSKHTEVLDYLKLDNAAKVAIPTGGHANVNMEQVLQWNPDYIFAAGFKADKNAYATITSSSMWSNISAVSNNKVYKVPTQPFGWFDHPPSVNRLPGIIWLSEIFYQLPQEEAKKQIVEFYKLFFLYDLSDQEYKSLFL